MDLSKLKFNNYVLYKFGDSVGAKTPMEAIQKLSILSEGNSFEAQDITSKLLHYCLNEEYTIEDCFEKLNDVETITALLKQVDLFLTPMVKLPKEEDEKKKEVIAEA